MRHSARFAPWARVVMGVVLLAAALPAQGEAALLPAAPRTGQSSRAAVNPPALGWQDQLVDLKGDAGQGLSMALDSSGYPHLAYYNLAGDPSLKYAAWDGVAWTFDTVDPGIGPIDATGLPVATGIAFAGGTAYIVYQTYDPQTGAGRLYYAKGGPGGWNIFPVEPLAGPTVDYAPALRVDPNGTLHLSFTARHSILPTASDEIVYARLAPESLSWVTYTVDTMSHWTAGGLVTALDLNARQQPRIAFAPATKSAAGTLTLAWSDSDGLGWQTQTIASGAFLPSIAIDSVGNPHMAFLADLAQATGLRYVTWSNHAWQVTDLDQWDGIDWGSQPLAIALDSHNHPAISVAIGSDLLFDQWDGAMWHTQVPVPGSPPAALTALALDAAGQPHIGYYDRYYGDLAYVSWGPAWITQTVAPAGDEVRLAVDPQSRPYLSYSTNTTSTNPLINSHVQLANWPGDGHWRYREVLPFSARGQSLRLILDANQQPVSLLTYTDLTAAEFGHLGFARWAGGTLVTQTIDGTYDGGWSPSLAFDSQANPIIGYVDLNNGGPPRIKYAASPDHGQSWNVLTDTAAPPLGPYSGLRSLSAGGSVVCCNTYVAYFDQASKALRLATWNGTQWIDEKVDGGNGDQAGDFVSLVADQTTGKPAMAYYDATQGAIRYALWRGGWVTTTVDSGARNVSDVSLSLAQGSDQYPRIAYSASAGNSLRLAWTTTPTATWTIDTVAQFSADPTVTFPAMRVASLALERDQIAYSSPNTGVVYAYRAATLPYALYYDPLQPCLDAQPPLAARLGHTLAQVRALSPAALSQVDDLTTLRALRDLFALGPAGQHYINLYYQYSHETGVLAVANPGLAWDAYRTLQNFLPGFLALAAGRGDTITITQSMVDQANNIADRLAAAGSPGLGAAINTERAKYNHLQAFAGKTFAQAATLLGVNAYRTYLPLLLR